jgi:hypothetical protein
MLIGNFFDPKTQEIAVMSTTDETPCVCVCVYIYTHTHTHTYTMCPRRNVPDFGRVFLMLK